MDKLYFYGGLDLSNYYFVFFINYDEQKDSTKQDSIYTREEDKSIMCKILRELHQKSAEYILQNYSDREQFPVDIVDVASRIGIRLGSVDFTELEKSNSFKDMVKEKGHILGSVRAKGDDLYINYHNALHDDPNFKHLSEIDKRDVLLRRQRFTIAHEIAHCCLHIDPDKYEPHIEYRTEQKDYGVNSKEREANIFAGELLIPFNILSDLSMIYNNKISVSLFADFFKVSKHVMKARLAQLIEEGKLQNVECFN